MFSFLNGKSPFDEAEERLEAGDTVNGKPRLPSGPIMGWQDGYQSRGLQRSRFRGIRLFPHLHHSARIPEQPADFPLRPLPPGRRRRLERSRPRPRLSGKRNQLDRMARTPRRQRPRPNTQDRNKNPLGNREGNRSHKPLKKKTRLDGGFFIVSAKGAYFLAAAESAAGSAAAAVAAAFAAWISAIFTISSHSLLSPV